MRESRPATAANGFLGKHERRKREMIEKFMYMYQAAPGETATLVADITGDAFIKVGKPMEPVPGDSSSWTLAIPITGFLLTYSFKAAVEFQNPPPGSRRFHH